MKKEEKTLFSVRIHQKWFDMWYNPGRGLFVDFLKLFAITAVYLGIFVGGIGLCRAVDCRSDQDIWACVKRTK